MWLLPIIRPLPGAPTAGPGDWIPAVVVMGLLAVAVVLFVAASLAQAVTAGHTARPEHRDKAA